MVKRVLITGGGGMLATDLVREWSDSSKWCITSLNKGELDVTNWPQVIETIQGIKPDLLIHTGAATDVDRCEREQEWALRINTWGTSNMARVCGLLSIEMVYISTCGLFGDETKANNEYEPVQLKTHYARSKYLAELELPKYNPRHYIIRPGWLFGGTANHRKNFVYQRFKEFQADYPVNSASDRYGSPTYTGDLAEKLAELVNTQAYGTYHLANHGLASRFEYVKEIGRSCGFVKKVYPVSSENFARSANVPACEALDNLRLKFLGLQPMAPWQEAMGRYIGKVIKEW